MAFKPISYKARYDYVTVPLLSLALVVLILNLWNADLTVPFNYNWDTLTYTSWIKGIIENGWWLQNQYLGAP